MLANFGGNVRFSPSTLYAPADEDEVLEILRRHRHRRFRAIGSLHSWSHCPADDGIVLDLKRLNQVRVHRNDDGKMIATVGAGCRIRRLLHELRRHGLTLPAVGLIDAQTIAGAIATGTHGSGRHSLSHYPTAIRAAIYDPVTDHPVVREWRAGAALRAARCSVGCTGIILTVALPAVPIPDVEEYTAKHETLDEVLALGDDYPLQQAYLIPWLWRWYAHHRRECAGGRSWWAPAYRLYRRLAIDYLFHALARIMAVTARRGRMLRGFYRRCFPALMLTGTRSADRMDRVLLMHHQVYRHVETELFVPGSRLVEAMGLVRAVLVYAAGQAGSLGEPYDEQVREMGFSESLARIGGIYTHHFPITLRRVLPDDTLISMAAGGDEPRWAISLITYGTADLAGFEATMAWLAAVTAELFDARPHWGKHNPLGFQSIDRLYPELRAFRQFCEGIDPDGRFRNDYADEKLGFAGKRP